MSKITVVDSICGAGKTSWAIQFMDNNFKDRYIYKIRGVYNCIKI